MPEESFKNDLHDNWFKTINIMTNELWVVYGYYYATIFHRPPPPFPSLSRKVFIYVFRS